MSAWALARAAAPCAIEWLSFLPVVSAIHSARRSRAIDAPIGVRAAIGAWLAGVGLAALVLGPDGLVRAWAAVTLVAALLIFVQGAADERRLHAWVRGAILQGAPVYEVRRSPGRGRRSAPRGRGAASGGSDPC